jgi:inositol oxygenase
MSASRNDFTPQEKNPLASLDEWEDAVLERYPEPGVPARPKEEYRNYADPVRDTVREF